MYHSRLKSAKVSSPREPGAIERNGRCQSVIFALPVKHAHSLESNSIPRIEMRNPDGQESPIESDPDSAH